ncbi:MAG: hypothetical protein K9M75_01165 [Phycisphaerae bacterium]|nr:hypothetical protein [Phycisphaerae bacterium]
MKLFSWKLLVLAFLLTFGFVFCYRISQTQGTASQSGCVKATVLTVLAAAAGVIPVILTYTHNKARVFFTAVMIGAIIRMFITAAGVLAVIYFLNEQRSWFLGWSAGFYLFFLAFDTSLVLYFLNKRRNQNKGIEKDGNAAFACKYESS